MDHPVFNSSFLGGNGDSLSFSRMSSKRKVLPLKDTDVKKESLAVADLFSSQLNLDEIISQIKLETSIKQQAVLPIIPQLYSGSIVRNVG